MVRSRDPRLTILKEFWKDSKLTQKEAGISMGISQSAIHQYLHGKISLNAEIIIKFSDVLGIAPSKIDPRIY